MIIRHMAPNDAAIAAGEMMERPSISAGGLAEGVGRLVVAGLLFNELAEEAREAVARVDSPIVTGVPFTATRKVSACFAVRMPPAGFIAISVPVSG